MLDKILFHLPAIYVLSPLISGLLIVIVGSKRASRYFFLICNLLLIGLAFKGYFSYIQPSSYSFGGWPQPIGIEFKYDKLASFGLVILSSISCYYSFFSLNILNNQIETILLPGRKHLIYAILLFIHTSFAGLILTNDIFNLYVFIEIASLTCCTALAIGRDPRGVVGAFDYLLIGTVGATLILVGIGLLLAISGTLNLSDLGVILKSNSSKFLGVTKLAAIVVILGCLIKIGLVPLHFWQIRAYSFSAPIFATYLVGTSTVVTLAVIVKIYASSLQVYLSDKLQFLQIVGVIAIIFGSLFAFAQQDLRRILVFSSFAQIGYYFVLWSYETSASFSLLLTMVITDCLVKFGLFLWISSLQSKDADFDIRNLIGVARQHKTVAITGCLLLLNSSGLPLTINFINKIKLLELMLASGKFFVMGIVLITSFITILYHFKIARQLFKNSEIKVEYRIEKVANLGALLISIILFLGVAYYNNIAEINLSLFKELYSDF